MELQSIKLLRSYHLIPNRKNRIPPFDVKICEEEAHMRYDNRTNAFVMEVDPKTVFDILSGQNIEYFTSETIEIEEFKNSYIVSRWLIKIFLEVVLFYYLEWLDKSENNDEEFRFEYDEKMKKLTNYVRLGKKSKVYNYEVRQIKPLELFSANDFIADINLTFNKDLSLSGMILKLYELEFVLKI